MTPPSNRRGFFRLMAGGTLRGAREAAPIMPLPVAVAVARIPEPREKPRDAAPTKAAPPAQRCVTRAELDEIVDQHGLEARRPDVQGCAVTGLRITATDDATNSYLAAGATPHDVPGVVTSWDDRLRLLAHLDLSDIAACERGELELPPAGSLELLWALDEAPTGLSASDVGSALVLLRSSHAPDRAGRVAGKPTGAHYVRLSAELSLPRAWTRRVSELGLSPDEADRWEALRRELAARQGIRLSFDEPGGSEFFSVHRLLGYPDERQGQMPNICEAGARGIDLGERPYYEHPSAAELEEASGRWRLLLQLSRDEAFGWDWGAGRDRLYVWIDQDDLQRGDFSRIWAITQ